MSNIYNDGTYCEANPDWHAEDSKWKSDKIFDFLLKNRLSFQAVCEVGCGHGGVLEGLFNSCDQSSESRYVGIDISVDAINYCRKNRSQALDFQVGEIKDYTKPEFELAMAIDVFEHVEDYFGFLREFKKMGEYKVFHIPLDLSVQTVFRMTPILAGRQEVGHIHYFTKDTALASLSDTGYEIVDFAYTPWSMELNQANIKSRLANIPRKIMYRLWPDFTVRLLGGFSLLVLAK